GRPHARHHELGGISAYSDSAIQAGGALRRSFGSSSIQGLCCRAAMTASRSLTSTTPSPAESEFALATSAGHGMPGGHGPQAANTARMSASFNTPSPLISKRAGDGVIG